MLRPWMGCLAIPRHVRSLSTAFKILNCLQSSNRHSSEDWWVMAERLENLEPIISKICQESSCSGLSLGVLRYGKVVHKADYGYRDVEAKTPPDSDTLYSINSMTKPMTAAAIGILVEDGLMRWDTPIHTILPGFGKNHGEVGKLITIVDLLSHRSGMISPDTFFFQDYNEILLQKGQEVKTFNYGKPKGAFRDSYVYNNFGYAVAGLVVEELSGMEFGSYLKTKIFDPLHLKRTTTSDVSNDWNIGKCYCVLENRELYPVPPPKVNTEKALEGAAGVKSTVNDLLRLYQNFMETGNDQIEQQSTSTKNSPFKQCATLIKAHSFMEGATLRENAYGLGWVRCQLPGVLGKQGINARLQMEQVTGGGGASRLCLYHEGLMPGSSTSVYTFPEEMTAVVVLQSGVALNDCSDWVSQQLIQTIFDVPELNSFVQLARDSAKRMLALVPSMHLTLDSQRVQNTKSSFDLGQYVGRYFNPIKNFFVEVTLLRDGLHLAFQGRKSQSHPLRHYHYDTFTWLMTHDEAAKRARLMVNYPANYYLLQFGVSLHGRVDRLYWVIENTFPEAETFLKE
ncbi:hypothetical protein JMJ35_002043 [Cladonia borealis]|uniref:Beta-lactamase-related domain-containing protein n=1 Tax=Cladonia borealis TaxID=184061 RepID=A0AA39R9C7_9LECA|nr:hypothetical protein JMJ35_002043 [Cladonia borealis]